MTSYKLTTVMLAILVLTGLLTTTYAEEEVSGSDKFSADDGSFSLSEAVDVTENVVRLKHLTAHAFSNAKYAEIIVCRKPLKNRPVTLAKSYLENIFRASGMDEKTLYLMEIPKEIKVSYAEVSFDKKNKVFVSKDNLIKENSKAENFVEIDSSEVLLVVSSYIETQLRKNDPQITIYHSNLASSWKVAVAEDYDLKVLPGIIIRSNNVSAKIGVYHKGLLIETKLFNFKADIFVKAFTAENNFEKGKVLSKDDFTFKLVPYSLNAMNAVRDEKSWVGFELQKSVRVGETVEPSDLKTPVLITRGAVVNIVIKDQGFSIRAIGIAQEMGRMGDQILVTMKSSNSKINCTVTGENTVDIIN